MKIILIKEVKNLGKTGEVKEVKEGYAKHYLIPQGLAALPGNVLGKEVRDEIIKKSQSKKAKNDDIRKQAAEIAGKKYVFNVKTDIKGHPYAAISPKEIAEKIGVDAHYIVEHYKQIGTFPLRIEFSKDIQAEVEIEIKKIS